MHPRLAETVLAWDGVAAEAGRFGSTRFLVGRRELGHVHGTSHVDLPFPRRIRDELIATGRVGPHRFAPDSGWATRDLRTEEDVDDAIALLRVQYDRARGAPAWERPAEDG